MHDKCLFGSGCILPGVSIEFFSSPFQQISEKTVACRVLISCVHWIITRLFHTFSNTTYSLSLFHQAERQFLQSAFPVPGSMTGNISRNSFNIVVFRCFECYIYSLGMRYCSNVCALQAFEICMCGYKSLNSLKAERSFGVSLELLVTIYPYNKVTPLFSKICMSGTI